MGAKVISFINYKGGVGKTTSTYHVGCSLAQHHKKKVLLVDIDPQTNLTFLCAPYEEWDKFKNRAGTIRTMYQRFQKKKSLDIKRYIWKIPIKIGKTRIPNLDLLPCDINLLGEDLGGGQVSGNFPTLEALRQQSQIYLRERAFLNNAFKEIDDKYDYILIDCPPNLYLMTQCAIVASYKYVVTAIPDHLSTIGLTILIDKVKKIGNLLRSAENFAGSSKKFKLNAAKFGGVIFVKVRIGGTMITTTNSDKMAEIRSLIGGKNCFKPSTTNLIGYSEAAQNSLPVWELDTTNAKRAANKMEYQRITNEFVARF